MPPASLHAEIGLRTPAMGTERLEQIRTLLHDEPDDDFLRYAMALELRRVGRPEEAIAVLEQLAVSSPEHIPTYYQLAALLAENGRMADAMAACEAGMLRCTVAADRRTRGELAALRDTISDATEG